MLDTAQMAAATRYCPEHLRRLVRAGRFPQPVKIGRRFLWPTSVLVELASGKLPEANSICRSAGVPAPQALTAGGDDGT